MKLKAILPMKLITKQLKLARLATSIKQQWLTMLPLHIEIDKFPLW